MPLWKLIYLVIVVWLVMAILPIPLLNGIAMGALMFVVMAVVLLWWLIIPIMILFIGMMFTKGG